MIREVFVLYHCGGRSGSGSRGCSSKNAWWLCRMVQEKYVSSVMSPRLESGSRSADGFTRTTSICLCVEGG